MAEFVDVLALTLLTLLGVASIVSLAAWIISMVREEIRNG
jgi:hypothetical protein